jgi:hypothetical protein
MTLTEFIRSHPRVWIAGESGDLLLEVCDFRAWRYTTRENAEVDAQQSCGRNRCRGTQFHRVIELKEPAPVKVNCYRD